MLRLRRRARPQRQPEPTRPKVGRFRVFGGASGDGALDNETARHCRKPGTAGPSVIVSS